MFVLGAFGFLHELFNSHAERPFMLALSGALMGLPFVIAADQLSTRADAQDDEDERWSHMP
jgi:hypothetical protein